MAISGRGWYFNENVDREQQLSRLLVSTTSNHQTRCMRCGTCCAKGGPTLHAQDRHIILEGHIGTGQLVTIRRGELAYSPIEDALRPIPEELVKIAGKGKGWECIFLDEGGSSCMIYQHRPLECRLLKCWDTTELLSVIFKDTLKRADIIDPGEPILKIMEDHEETCSVGKMEAILSSFAEGSDRAKSLTRLGELIRKDLAIRAEAVSVLGLSLEMELFVLGRPLFTLLNKRGLSVEERHGRIYIGTGSRNPVNHDTIDLK